MKTLSLTVAVAIMVFACNSKKEDSSESVAKESTDPKQLYIDVHDLGKVAFADVAEAHKKDLATQGKYDVNFIKYWVDEAAGKVYCLSEAASPQMVSDTHKEAHGLIPARIHLVSDGPEVSLTGKQLFLDMHKLGPGKVNAKDVADAHDKDLAVQGKYGVSFINYWVDEKEGVIMCLSEAPDSSAVIKTHQEAHGLLPHEIASVKQGQ
ncbi:MAG: DUF4242 domain-containing protein [Cyclobacteriaceae bacterium]